MVPTIDFGHLNAFTLGELNNKQKFDKVFEKINSELGEVKLKNLHIHFSKIMYTEKGEKMHLTLEDEEYGPSYNDFLSSLLYNAPKDNNITVVSESKAIMAQDALILKNKYKELIKEK